MNLQALIDQAELGITIDQIKAFFLGSLIAEKPFTFHMAFEELLVEFPEAKTNLEFALKKLWNDLESNKKTELKSLFPEDTNLEAVSGPLDFFLTALSLAGTTSDNCDNEELGDLLEELEEIVMEIDDLLAEEDADEEELKSYFQEIWQELLNQI